MLGVVLSVVLSVVLHLRSPLFPRCALRYARRCALGCAPLALTVVVPVALFVVLFALPVPRTARLESSLSQLSLSCLALPCAGCAENSGAAAKSQCQLPSAPWAACAARSENSGAPANCLSCQFLCGPRAACAQKVEHPRTVFFVRCLPLPGQPVPPVPRAAERPRTVNVSCLALPGRPVLKKWSTRGLSLWSGVFRFPGSHCQETVKHLRTVFLGFLVFPGLRSWLSRHWRR
jgi:hypothetical protein